MIPWTITGMNAFDEYVSLLCVFLFFIFFLPAGLETIDFPNFLLLNIFDKMTFHLML